MTERELIIAALAQMLAPKLFELSGDIPEEMGFPIYDTQAEVHEHLERQFTPIEYWTNKATEIAEAIVDTLSTGGDLVSFDTDKIIKRSTYFAKIWQEIEP